MKINGQLNRSGLGSNIGKKVKESDAVTPRRRKGFAILVGGYGGLIIPLLGLHHCSSEVRGYVGPFFAVFSVAAILGVVFGALLAFSRESSAGGVDCGKES
jgi:hypothetical protein